MQRSDDYPSNFVQPLPPENHSAQKQHERNYSITVLRIVIYCICLWEIWNIGYSRISSHCPDWSSRLTFLFQYRLRNTRLTRWMLHLQELNLHVKRIPRSDNVIDALSRRPGRTKGGRESYVKISMYPINHVEKDPSRVWAPNIFFQINLFVPEGGH